MSRQSEYTPEIGGIICERIAEGESLRAICRCDEMPAMSTVFKWLVTHSKFSEQYAHARDAQADALADEILDIADDGSRDYAMVDGREVVDHDHIARSRLRVDTRKWIASKLKPKKYGEKLEVESTVTTFAVEVPAQAATAADWSAQQTPRLQ